jgi:hypothetical protein
LLELSSKVGNTVREEVKRGVGSGGNWMNPGFKDWLED